MTLTVEAGTLMQEHADVILLAGYVTPFVIHFGGFAATWRLEAPAASAVTTVVAVGIVSVKTVVLWISVTSASSAVTVDSTVDVLILSAA